MTKHNSATGGGEGAVCIGDFDSMLATNENSCKRCHIIMTSLFHLCSNIIVAIKNLPIPTATMEMLVSNKQHVAATRSLYVCRIPVFSRPTDWRTMANLKNQSISFFFSSLLNFPMRNILNLDYLLGIDGGIERPAPVPPSPGTFSQWFACEHFAGGIKVTPLRCHTNRPLSLSESAASVGLGQRAYNIRWNSFQLVSTTYDRWRCHRSTLHHSSIFIFDFFFRCSRFHHYCFGVPSAILTWIKKNLLRFRFPPFWCLSSTTRARWQSWRSLCARKMLSNSKSARSTPSISLRARALAWTRVGFVFHARHR